MESIEIIAKRQAAIEAILKASSVPLSPTELYTNPAVSPVSTSITQISNYLSSRFRAGKINRIPVTGIQGSLYAYSYRTEFSSPLATHVKRKSPVPKVESIGLTIMLNGSRQHVSLAEARKLQVALNAFFGSGE
jgi:hypothetical protein